MKYFVSTIIAIFAMSAGAQSQKDRGGGQVPYAEGVSSVTLSWNHSESMIELQGNSAELLYKSLRVQEKAESSPFARVGAGPVKEKGNIKCSSTRSQPKAYSCLVRVQN